MTSAMMKRLIPLVVLVMVSAGSCAFAGSGYDSCRQEEKRLRLDEADQCSGWEYVLNPSACFNTRKALAPYVGGKCRAIAVSEGMEEKAEATAPLPLIPAALARESTSAALAQSSELELLKKEVAELKAELELLKKEVVKLREGR